MNLDLALVLLTLTAAIVMFVINQPRMYAVALLVMVALPSPRSRGGRDAIASYLLISPNPLTCLLSVSSALYFGFDLWIVLGLQRVCLVLR
jgi:hypothetical protein